MEEQVRTMHEKPKRKKTRIITLSSVEKTKLLTMYQTSVTGTPVETWPKAGRH